MGKAERTENDPAFENLSKKTDKVKGYTEKLVKNTEAVLVPNPGKAPTFESVFQKIHSNCIYIFLQLPGLRHSCLITFQ